MRSTLTKCSIDLLRAKKAIKSEKHLEMAKDFQKERKQQPTKVAAKTSTERASIKIFRYPKEGTKCIPADRCTCTTQARSCSGLCTGPGSPCTRPRRCRCGCRRRGGTQGGSGSGRSPTGWCNAAGRCLENNKERNMWRFFSRFLQHWYKVCF